MESSHEPNSANHGYISVLIEMEGCFDEDEDEPGPEDRIRGKDTPPFPASSLSPVDLEELESFAKRFKNRRAALGYTQGDVGMNVGRFYGHDFSQTTVSRFEALNLSFKNMCKLKPILEKWLQDAEAGRLPSPSVDRGKLAEENVERRLPPPLPLVSSKRRRRRRTSIGHSSLTQLELMFGEHRKPSGVDLEIIGDKLGLEKEVVRVWFCNRRQKYKRDIKRRSAGSSADGDPDFSEDEDLDGAGSSGSPPSTSDTTTGSQHLNNPFQGEFRRKSGLLLQFDESNGTLPATVTLPVGGDTPGRIGEQIILDHRRPERTGPLISDPPTRNLGGTLPGRGISPGDADSQRSNGGVLKRRRKTVACSSGSGNESVTSVRSGHVLNNHRPVPSGGMTWGSTGTGSGGTVPGLNRYHNSSSSDCVLHADGTFNHQNHQQLFAPNQLPVFANTERTTHWNPEQMQLGEQPPPCWNSHSLSLTSPNNNFWNAIPSTTDTTATAASCLESAVQRLLNSSCEEEMAAVAGGCRPSIGGIYAAGWPNSRLSEVNLTAGDVMDAAFNKHADHTITDCVPVGLPRPELDDLIAENFDIPIVTDPLEAFHPESSLLPHGEKIELDTAASAKTNLNDPACPGEFNPDVAAQFCEEYVTSSDPAPDSDQVPPNPTPAEVPSTGLVFDSNGFPVVLTIADGSQFLLFRRSGAEGVCPIPLASLTAILQNHNNSSNSTKHDQIRIPNIPIATIGTTSLIPDSTKAAGTGSIYRLMENVGGETGPCESFSSNPVPSSSSSPGAHHLTSGSASVSSLENGIPLPAGSNFDFDRSESEPQKSSREGIDRLAEFPSSSSARIRPITDGDDDDTEGNDGDPSGLSNKMAKTESLAVDPSDCRTDLISRPDLINNNCSNSSKRGRDRPIGFMVNYDTSDGIPGIQTVGIDVNSSVLILNSAGVSDSAVADCSPDNDSKPMITDNSGSLIEKIGHTASSTPNKAGSNNAKCKMSYEKYGKLIPSSTVVLLPNHSQSSYLDSKPAITADFGAGGCFRPADGAKGLISGDSSLNAAEALLELGRRRKEMLGIDDINGSMDGGDCSDFSIGSTPLRINHGSDSKLPKLSNPIPDDCDSLQMVIGQDPSVVARDIKDSMDGFGVTNVISADHDEGDEEKILAVNDFVDNTLDVCSAEVLMNDYVAEPDDSQPGLLASVDRASSTTNLNR